MALQMPALSPENAERLERRSRALDALMAIASAITNTPLYIKALHRAHQRARHPLVRISAITLFVVLLAAGCGKDTSQIEHDAYIEGCVQAWLSSDPLGDTPHERAGWTAHCERALASASPTP